MPNLAELRAFFDRLGIDVSRPGFYDNPIFIKAERRDPRFITKYGQYLEALQFDNAYLNRARQTALRVADYLFEELRKDGRKGACIDVSGTAVRMLEEEGIWNYMVSGAVVVDFPHQSGLRRRYFWPLRHPDNPAK